MLSGVKVVELSHSHTALAGQILADLGADVLVIEPPAGSAVRRMEPFKDGPLDVESSLVWQALNRGKRAITLDVRDPDGVKIFNEIIADAEILVRSVELDPTTTRLPDTAVECVVRPYSSSGPKAGYAYTDMVLQASTGSLANTGDPDRAPVMLPVPQVVMEAGAEAAIASIAGILASRQTGEGQRIAVSARIATMMSALSLPYLGLAPAWERPRATSVLIAGVDVPTVLPCRDGYFLVSVAFGGFVGMTVRMANLLASLGLVESSVAQTDWPSFLADYEAGECTNEPLSGLVRGLERFGKSHTKAQVTEYAGEHRFFAAPMMEMSDVAAFEQFRDRGLWRDIEMLGSVVPYPSQFAQITNYELKGTQPAPRLSQHTSGVLFDLGYQPTEVQALFASSII